MSTNSFFNQKSIQTIKKIHKGFLWVASGILIVSLVLGGILIFVDPSANGGAFAQVQGTFTILALAAFICVNNFIRIEKGDKLIQGFALTGLFANMIWVVMGILMIWGVFSPVEISTSGVKAENTTVRTYDYRTMYNNALDSEYDDYGDYDYDYDYNYDDYDDYDDYDGYDDYDDSYNYRNYNTNDSYSNELESTMYATPQTVNITIGARLLMVALSVAALGFWVSNVLAIKDRLKVVKSLKIVAVVCEVIVAVSVIIFACGWPITFDQNTLKWVQLFGLISSGFFVTALAAWIISITHKDFEVVSVQEEARGKELVAEINKKDEVSLTGEDQRIKEEEKVTTEVGDKAERTSLDEDVRIEERPVESSNSDNAESGFEGFSDNNAG